MSEMPVVHHRICVLPFILWNDLAKNRAINWGDFSFIFKYRFFLNHYSQASLQLLLHIWAVSPESWGVIICLMNRLLQILFFILPKREIVNKIRKPHWCTYLTMLCSASTVIIVYNPKQNILFYKPKVCFLAFEVQIYRTYLHAYLI